MPEASVKITGSSAGLARATQDGESILAKFQAKVDARNAAAAEKAAAQQVATEQATAAKRIAVAEKTAARMSELDRKAQIEAAANAKKAGEKTAQAAEQAAAAGVNARAYRLANISNQVQDIAVQLQGGAHLTTVIAQQGSQIFSALGTTGAFVGATIAIGAGLINMGIAANEGFTNLVTGSEKARAALDRVNAGSSLKDILEGVRELNKVNADVGKGTSHTSALFSGVGGLFKGHGLDDFHTKATLQQQLAEQESLNTAKITEANDRALQISKQDVAVLSLKAQGLEKEAAALERKRKLESDILEIEQSDLTVQTQKALIADAHAKDAELDAKEFRERQRAVVLEAAASFESVKADEQKFAIAKAMLEGRKELLPLLQMEAQHENERQAAAEKGLDATARSAMLHRQIEERAALAKETGDHAIEQARAEQQSLAQQAYQQFTITASLQTQIAVNKALAAGHQEQADAIKRSADNAAELLAAQQRGASVQEIALIREKQLTAEKARQVQHAQGIAAEQNRMVAAAAAAFNQNVNDAMNPGQAQRNRQEQRERARIERRLINQEVDRQDRAIRKRGDLSGLTEKEKQELRSSLTKAKDSAKDPNTQILKSIENQLTVLSSKVVVVP